MLHSAPGFMLLLLLVMSTLFWSLWGYLFGIFFWWGQLHSSQIIFGLLPHHPKIHHRDYNEGTPFNAEMSGVSQTCEGISRVYSHCTSPESIVHSIQHEDQAQASQALGDLIPACKLKFWYLHGSQFQVFHVPHLSGAGWSSLPWGVLPAVLGLTIPDSPASAGSLSTGGAGVEALLFSTLATGASFSPCPMLELMGSK